MRTTENDTTWTQQYMKKIIILSFLFVQGCGITVRKKKKGGRHRALLPIPHIRSGRRWRCGGGGGDSGGKMWRRRQKWWSGTSKRRTHSARCVATYTSPRTLVWVLACLALGLEQVPYASVVGEFGGTSTVSRRLVHVC